MKAYLSILIAIISFFTASHQPEKDGSTVNNGFYGEYGYTDCKNILLTEIVIYVK
jgi:hypothetical protein